MRCLIFGDVHGNLPALELLFRMEKGNYDFFVCHGDIVGYGPWMNESVDFLATFSNATLLMGNHEEYFISGNYPGSHPVAKTFFDYCYPNFDRYSLITEYGKEHQLEHYKIMHSIEGRYIFKDTVLDARSLSSNYIIGHSHQQFTRKVGNHEIVNTGSLGQNREYINVSNYIVYNSVNRSIELKYFINDIAKMINEMKHRKYPTACINYYASKKQANG